MTDIATVSSGHLVGVRDSLDSWVDVVRDVSTLATQIADTDFVPKGLRGNPAAVTAAVLYGREVGLGPMAALQSINVVHGKPSISAEMMRALVLQAGHELEFTDSTATRCVVRGRRGGSTAWTEATFTFDEAKAAGLTGSNQNYRTRPAEMLVARATTRLCRRLFADVIHGLWSAEEADDYAAEETTSAGVAGAPVVTGKRTAQRKTRTKPVTAAIAPAPADTAPPTPATTDLPPLPGDHHDEPEPDTVAELVTTKQLTAIATATGAVGYTDRTDKLRLCAWLVGRDLTSSKDLSKREAAQVLDVLAQAQATDDPEGFLDRVVAERPSFVEQPPVTGETPVADNTDTGEVLDVEVLEPGDE